MGGMLHTAAERETATEGDRGGEGCWHIPFARVRDTVQRIQYMYGTVHQRRVSCLSI